MIYLHTTVNINIAWSIYRDGSNILEDFTSTTPKLFLVGEKDKYPLEYTAADGVISANISKELVLGAYSVQLIWEKDADEASNDNFGWHPLMGKWVQAFAKDIFMVVDDTVEETDIPSGSKLNFHSHVATFGYDGLSSYELAVITGRFSGTLQEYIDSWIGTDLSDYYKKEETGEFVDAKIKAGKVEVTVGYTNAITNATANMALISDVDSAKAEITTAYQKAITESTSDLVTHSEMASSQTSFVTKSDLSSAETDIKNNYEKAISESVDGLVTQEQLTQSEASLTTKAALDAATAALETKLNNKITTTTEGLVTTEQLSTSIANFIAQSDLDSAKTEITTAYTQKIEESIDGLVTESELTTATSNFVTQADLNQAKAELTTAYTKEISDSVGSQVTSATSKFVQQSDIDKASAEITTNYQKAITDSEGNIKEIISSSNFVTQSTLDSAKAALETEISDGITTAKSGMVSLSDLNKALIQLRAEYKQDTSDALAGLDFTSDIDKAKAELKASYTSAISEAVSGLVSTSTLTETANTLSSKFYDKTTMETKLAEVKTYADSKISEIDILADILTATTNNFKLDSSGNLEIGGTLKCTNVITLDGTTNIGGVVNFGDLIKYDKSTQQFIFGDSTTNVAIDADDCSIIGKYNGDQVFSMYTHSIPGKTNAGLYIGTSSVAASVYQDSLGVTDYDSSYKFLASTRTLQLGYTGSDYTTSKANMIIDTSGNYVMIKLSSLPTSSQGAGYLYNDNGTIKIGQ